MQPAPRLSIIFKQPDITSIDNIYAKPFESRLWIAIATLYIFLFIFGYMMEYFSKYSCKNNKSMLMLPFSWGIRNYFNIAAR